MITVAELIIELQKLPLDHAVVISGYEGGFKDASDAVPITLLCDVNKEWYYGPHEVDSEGERRFHELAEDHPTKPGVLIR